MTRYATVLADLTRHLSRSEFEKAVRTYNADKGVKTLKTRDMFRQTCYGQLSGCFSVRETENSMRANRSRLYHAGIPPLKRSAYCDALEKRDYRVFEDLFHAAVNKAQLLAGNRKKRFKDPLRIIDASIIPVCLKRFDWARYRKAKGAVKPRLCLDGDNLFPHDARMTNGKVHDVKAMDRLCGETGVIYVLDRGYVDYNSLYHIELGGSTFVTRMKSNGKYKRIRNNVRNKDGPVVSDVIIELTGSETKKHYPEPLRKIKYYDKQSRHTYEFITNDMKTRALDIAAIYKERWQVELLFKWIKQHLKVKSFWGTSENAVWIQLWTALILTVLLWIKRTIDGIMLSANQLLQMMKTTLLCKKSISGLCTNVSPPPEIPSSQLVWDWAL
jgi:hypothetical protein